MGRGVESVELQRGEERIGEMRGEARGRIREG